MRLDCATIVMGATLPCHNVMLQEALRLAQCEWAKRRQSDDAALDEALGELTEALGLRAVGLGDNYGGTAVRRGADVDV